MSAPELANIEVNFNNNDEGHDNGSATKGICIYNQRYNYEDNAITSESALGNLDIVDRLNKVLTCEHGFAFVEDSSSNPFAGLKLDGEDTIKRMAKNQILVFKCTKPIGEGSYCTYYCYLKDKDGNSWMIYIHDKKRHPVVFDIQEDLEIKFTATTDSNSVTTVTSVDTGNFSLTKIGTEFNYNDIELKNTSFNLAVNEKAETKVNIKPVGIVIAKTN